MPTEFAISVGDLPCSCCRITSADFARAVGLRPRYFPSARAFSMPSRWRSSIISLSNCAKPAKIVRINCPVADVVSTTSPPRFRTRSPTPRFFRPSTMDHRPVVLRASRSTLVTTSVSPLRTNERAFSNSLRFPTDETRSAKISSHPAATRSRVWAARPASCSEVDVLPYPTSMLECPLRSGL